MIRIATIILLLLAAALGSASPAPQGQNTPLALAQQTLSQCRKDEAKLRELFDLGVVPRKRVEDASAATAKALAEVRRLQTPVSTMARPTNLAAGVVCLSEPASASTEPNVEASPGVAAAVTEELSARLDNSEEALAAEEQRLAAALATLAEGADPEEPPSLADLAASARKYVGVRYRWGGTTSRGFDCSGLIYRLLQFEHRAAPRTAAGLFTLGRPVRRDELQSGDLVFFKDTYQPGISHVGIYLTGDDFIHASGTRGGVTVSSLEEPFYSEHYAGARRLEPEAKPAE